MGVAVHAPKGHALPEKGFAVAAVSKGAIQNKGPGFYRQALKNLGKKDGMMGGRGGHKRRRYITSTRQKHFGL